MISASRSGESPPDSSGLLRWADFRSAPMWKIIRHLPPWSVSQYPPNRASTLPAIRRVGHSRPSSQPQNELRNDVRQFIVRFDPGDREQVMAVVGRARSNQDAETFLPTVG